MVCACAGVCVSVHEWVFAREYISWKFKVGTCVCMLLHSGHLQQTKHPLWPSTFRGFCRRCRSTRVLHVSTMPNGNKVLQPALLHHPHLVPPVLWGIERAHYGRYLFTQWCWNLIQNEGKMSTKKLLKRSMPLRNMQSNSVYSQNSIITETKYRILNKENCKRIL